MLTTEPTIIDQFVKAGKVKLVFRNVLSYAERSFRTGEAAACAGAQSPAQFWAMHGVLFERQATTWATSGDDKLVALMNKWASELPGLDSASFAQCLASNATLGFIQATDREQRKNGIVTQPVFEITNGKASKRLFGNQAFDAFRQEIESQLK